MLIYVREAIGSEERNILLGNNLLSDLRNYFTQYKPQDYLFEEQNGGKHSTELKIINNSEKKDQNKIDCNSAYSNA